MAGSSRTRTNFVTGVSRSRLCPLPPWAPISTPDARNCRSTSPAVRNSHRLEIVDQPYCKAASWVSWVARCWSWRKVPDILFEQRLHLGVFSCRTSELKQCAKLPPFEAPSSSNARTTVDKKITEYSYGPLVIYIVQNINHKRAWVNFEKDGQE